MIIATLGKITAITDIEKADRLKLAVVDCGKSGVWRGVVPLNEFSPEDLCEVYLPDAIVPPTERFSFMEKRHYRVSQTRFRGARSECLIVAPTPEVLSFTNGRIGTDISSVVGATKYNKPMPTGFGDAAGSFPWFIPKTDEPNIQSAQHLLDALQGQPYYASVKIDGTSGTAYAHSGHIGCCSRNWELKDAPNSMTWNVCRETGIINFLKKAMTPVALQFEVYGPGVQGNPTGVPRITCAIFNAYKIDERRYLDHDQLRSLCAAHVLPMVHSVEFGSSFDHDYESLQEICSRLKYRKSKTPIEGIVVRSRKEQLVDGDRLSFKVINLKYAK